MGFSGLFGYRVYSARLTVRPRRLSGDRSWRVGSQTLQGRPLCSKCNSIKIAQVRSTRVAFISQNVRAKSVCEAATASTLVAVLEDAWKAGTSDELLTCQAFQKAAIHKHDTVFRGTEVDMQRLLRMLERYVWQNMIAFSPQQLGFVIGRYAMLGGSSPSLLAALHSQCFSWNSTEYSLEAIASFCWAFPGNGWAKDEKYVALLQANVQDHQRDWQQWFSNGSGSQIILLLRDVVSFHCQPCSAFCKEVCARVALLTWESSSSKSLVALLWALARLEVCDMQAADASVAAVSQELSRRIGLQLSSGCKQPVAKALPVSLSAIGNEGAATQSTSSNVGSAPGGSEPAGNPSAGAPAQGRTATHWENGMATHLDEELSASMGSSSAKEDFSADNNPLEGDLSPALLSTLVWSWGRLKYRDRAALKAVSKLLQASGAELARAEVTRVLWGLAQLDFTQALLLGTLCSQMRERSMPSSFTMHQLATVVHALGSLDFFPGEPLLRELAECCLREREQLEPSSMCHILWGMTRLGYADELFFQQLAPVVCRDIQQYTPAQLADVCRVYAKLNMAPEGLYNAIAEQTVACLGAADIQDLLRILTAFNQLGLQPDALLAAVDAWADQRLRQLPPQALSLALGTFARLGSPRSSSLMAAAAECVARQLDRFAPGQLALVAWSFSKLDFYAKDVLDHALGQLASNTPKFNDKAVSNVLWAVATQKRNLMDSQITSHLDSIANNLQGRLKAFGAQSLSNIAWAYATLSHKPSRNFLDELGGAAAGQLSAFEPQGLALLVWALASLGHRHEALLMAIEQHCSSKGRLREFEVQHLSNLLWGMAKVGFCPGDHFWKQYTQEAASLASNFGSQEIFNVGWSMATLRLRPSALLDNLAAEAARRPFALSSQELSGLLWALARLRHASRGGAAKLLQASDEEVQQRLGDFEDRHLAVTVWAWGELGYLPSSAAQDAVWRELRGRAGKLGAHSLCTLIKGLGSISWCPTPQLAEAMLCRALQLSPAMKPFECAELLEGLMSLGLREEAHQLLRHLASTTAKGGKVLRGGNSSRTGSEELPCKTSSIWNGGRGQDEGAPLRDPVMAAEHQAREPHRRRGQTLLDRAATTAPLPSAMRLLATMAQLQLYPEPAFLQISKRLRAAAPSYRFSLRDLRHLGTALATADPAHRSKIRLQKGLQYKVDMAMEAVHKADTGVIIGVQPAAGLYEMPDSDPAQAAQDGVETREGGSLRPRYLDSQGTTDTGLGVAGNDEATQKLGSISNRWYPPEDDLDRYKV